MAQPSDLQAATSGIQWTNGRGLITGATLSSLFAIVLSILAGMGTWDATGNFTPNISGPITVTSLTTPQLPGLSTGVTAPATFAFPTGYGLAVPDTSKPFVVVGTATTPAQDTNAGLLYVAKTTTYTGNQGGVAPAIYAFVKVNEGNTSNEEAGQFTLFNAATQHSQADGAGGTASEVALGAQAICGIANCVATWGSVITAYDTSGQINPPHPFYGLEVDNYAKGTDNNQSRIGLQIVCSTADGSSTPLTTPDGPTTARNVCGHGLLLSSDGTHGKFQNMIDGGLSYANTGIEFGAMHYPATGGAMIHGPVNYQVNWDGSVIEGPTTIGGNVSVPSGAGLVAQAAGALLGQLNYTSPNWYFDATEAGGGWNFRGPSAVVAATIYNSGVLQLRALTVASLPTCNAALDGSIARVADAATTPSYNAPIGAGGGANESLLLCRNATWTFH